jgi:uncharacterized protein YjbJ (UPF0337 family)
MDNDSLVGSVKQINGAVKQVVGKAVGDARLKSNRKADKFSDVKNTLKGSRASTAHIVLWDRRPPRLVGESVQFCSDIPWSAHLSYALQSGICADARCHRHPRRMNVHTQAK